MKKKLNSDRMKSSMLSLGKKFQEKGCPDDAAVDGYRAGKLSKKDSKDFEKHLIFCDRCISRVTVVESAAEEQMPAYVWSAVQKGFEHDRKREEKEYLAEITDELAEYYLNRGIRLGRSQRHSEALAFFEKALKLSPLNIRAYRNKGVALTNLGKLDEGLFNVEQAIKISPRIAYNYYSRGWILFLMGKIKDAFESYKKAATLNPEHAEAFYDMALSSLKLGNPGNCRKYLKIALNKKHALIHFAKEDLFLKEEWFPGFLAEWRKEEEERGSDLSEIQGALDYCYGGTTEYS